MAELPGVSFLVPVFNKAPHLPVVLRQISRQTGNFPRQFVFVDDESTDGSFELVRELTADWQNVVVQCQSNKGASSNLSRKVMCGVGTTLACPPCPAYAGAACRQPRSEILPNESVSLNPMRRSKASTSTIVCGSY